MPLIKIRCIFVLISISLLDISSTCRVDICSREYSSVLEMSQSKQPVKTDHYCQLLHAYQQCVRSVAKSCRGHLSFHTIQTLLKSWKYQFNCTSSKSVLGDSNVGGGKRPRPVSQDNRRSGFNTPIYHIPENPQQRILQQQQRLQNCLSAAYNFTINSGSEVFRVERTRLVPVTESDTISDIQEGPNEPEITANVYSSASRTGNSRRFRNRLARNNPDIPVKRFIPIVPSDDEEDTDESEEYPDKPTNLIGTPPEISSPLTCIVFGDPHLKTIDNNYQTCKCVGAWPLIDHPLFAVQITNSRFKDSSSPQVTGVSKITVLVRQFTRCDIHNDLLYEADSSNQGSLPTTFIDGSSATTNNLIRITSTININVVTIHLDHIGVRVYIGQFTSSNYLNIIVKFRSATSPAKQQLVLNAISANSLCKIGCPHREKIDIYNILSATGVNLETVTPKEVNNFDEFANTRNILSKEASDKKSEDPCTGLYGYYRISCLYDVVIKGVKDVNNACRFAQSFDELKNINMSLVSSSENVLQLNSGESIQLTRTYLYIACILLSIHSLFNFVMFL